MTVLESFIQMSLVELLLASGGFLLTVLVIPTLREPDAAVPRTQSVLSAVVLLFFFAIPYFWMEFYVSATVNLLSVVLWSLVAIYRAPSKNTEGTPSTTSTTNTNPQPAD